MVIAKTPPTHLTIGKQVIVSLGILSHPEAIQITATVMRSVFLDDHCLVFNHDRSLKLFRWALRFY